MRRPTYVVLGLLAALVVGIACGGDDGGTEEAAPSATTAPSAEAGAQIDFTSASGILGGDPEFDFSALIWQGYWLSRDNFGPSSWPRAWGYRSSPQWTS